MQIIKNEDIFVTLDNSINVIGAGEIKLIALNKEESADFLENMWQADHEIIINNTEPFNTYTYRDVQIMLDKTLYG